MAEFLRKWLLGIGSAWAFVGCVSAYVYFGGPLPSTKKVWKSAILWLTFQYLDQKHAIRLRDLERLAEVDLGLDELLADRNAKRKQWRELRTKYGAQS